MTKEEFYESLKKIGITLSNEQKQKFILYSTYLQEYNKKVNLTAITNEKDIYLKHFYDSIISSKFFEFSNQSVLDIGTGAGFPGIPLLICFPNLKLTLLDSNNKKTKFLESLKGVLKLDYTVVTGRAEKLDQKEEYDVVISRAVSNLRILLELSIPLLKTNGNLIAYKAIANEEVSSSDNALKKLNSKIKSMDTIKIFDNIRTIIIISKSSKTNPLYPRSYSKIKKSPL